MVSMYQPTYKVQMISAYNKCLITAMLTDITKKQITRIHPVPALEGRTSGRRPKSLGASAGLSVLTVKSLLSLSRSVMPITPRRLSFQYAYAEYDQHAIYNHLPIHIENIYP